MKKSILTLAVMSAVAMQSNAGTVTSDGSDIVIKTNGGFGVKTADGKKAFNIGGRIMWDYNRAEENGVADENAFDVRRARVFLKGQVNDWGYKAQWNIDEDGEDGGTIEDLYLRYTGWGKKANVTIGHHKAPFGLEQQISSNDMSVLERTAVTELFALGRQDGVQLHGKGSNWTYGIGVYEGGDSDAKRGADNISIAARATFAPVNENGNVFHLGLGAYSAGGIDAGADAFGLEDAVNLEIAGVAGSFHYQAEFFDGTLLPGDMIDGDEDVDGYYVQAGWILTGEARPYKDGKFKIVKPSSDKGAWEVVARYEDGAGNFGDVELGDTEAEAYTIGVNYYSNAIRIGVNFTDAEDDLTDSEGEEFRVRFQYVYK